MDDRPRSPREVRRWARERRPAEREAPPLAGERLLFRQSEFGPVIPVITMAVQDLARPGDHWRQHGDLERFHGPGEPDPSVWEWDEAEGRYRLHPDPWPWVQVQEAGADGRPLPSPPRWCREARVRGSAGWMREGSRAHTGHYGEEE